MGGKKRTNSTVASYLDSSTAWRRETEALRAILLDCGLDESIKWGLPCYTYDGHNVAIIQPMKAFLALMFFKGALLKDAEGMLKRPGDNSHAARRFEFTSERDIVESRAVIERRVREAIDVEAAGLEVDRAVEYELPDELVAKFDREPAFKAAFDALTPGRQRGYAIYFSSAKQSETRARRIEKYASKILAGKGFHDP